MTVTMEDVRAALDPEEPDYEEAVELGPEALPHLQVLVNLGDPMLASKAAYLASLIDDVRAEEVVEDAARNVDPIVRVAAAAAAANLGTTVSSHVLRNLVNDPDAGVRKVAGKWGGALGLAGPPEGEEVGIRETPTQPIVRGLMPGESPNDTAATGLARMPGEMPTGMPGESGQRSGMGEMPGARRTSQGEMPD